MYQELAEEHPEDYLPSLALALNDLGTHLGQLGRAEDAVAPAQQAIAIYRRLAEEWPDAHQSNPAMADRIRRSLR